MSKPHLSTYDVARILTVNESSVKRWANNGDLKCFKTPGGHRKFLLKDVIEFSEKYSIETWTNATAIKNINGSKGKDLELAILSKNFESLSIFLESFINKNEHEKAIDFLNILYANKISLSDIYDRIVQPVLEHIGYLWEKDKLPIDVEHLSTEIVRRVLNKFEESIHKKEPNGYSAICSCPEGEYHDIAINCVRYALEAQGWLVYYMGANLPAASLIKAIKSYKPNLVCISMTDRYYKKIILRALSKIYSVVKNTGGRLVLGGSSALEYGRENSNCSFVADSISDLISYSLSITHK
jgi:methanogenic corrinoid protein MtbC1